MRFIRFLIPALGLLMLFAQPLKASSHTVITHKLQQRIETSKADDLIRINIRLEHQFDARKMIMQLQGVNNPQLRRDRVTKSLKSFAEQSQKELLTFLANQEKSNRVQQIRSLWIVNVVNCYVTPDMVEELAAFPGIARLDYDNVEQILDTAGGPFEVMQTDKLDRNPVIAWNVNLVNAPQVWKQGYTGEGIIVAVLDTGVNGNHQDLAGRMWQHPDFPGNGYNFVNDNHNTSDLQGHGTHCAGTVAGNGTAGTITGMAPGATIMALKVLNDQGGGTQSGVWQAIEFSVEHGAHIMSLSLGWPHSANPDRAAWRIAMENAMNAGVIAAVAAGNEGGGGSGTQPPPNNIRTPGDCPAPWTHPDQATEGGNSAVVTVGSTTATDDVSSFSSKGPVTWQNVAPFNDYTLNPGSGLIIPDVMAPGSNVLSLRHNNNTGYIEKSGTSMATPAVAGIMALMLSKNPMLTPEDVSRILEETAVKLVENQAKNNIWGSGRVDALAAVDEVQGSVVFISHSINDEEGNDDGMINPGELIHFSMVFENFSTDSVNGVSVQLLTESPYITLLSDSADLGDFEGEEIREYPDLFTIQVADDLPGLYEIVFEVNIISDDEPSKVWRSVFTEIAHAPLLVFHQVEVDDSLWGNGNGTLDPGESVKIMASIENKGQVASESVNLSITSESPWLRFHSEETIAIPAINSGATSQAAIWVTVLHQTPAETVAELLLEANSGPYQIEDSQNLIVGAVPVYSAGNIPSTLNQNPTVHSSAIHPGVMTVSIPQGATITAVDVEYRIASVGGAWVRDQRSFLKCISEGGTAEATIASGPAGNTGGMVDYHRAGLDIANNVQGGGDITFELHVFRTWGGAGSSTQYVYVPNFSWRIIVHYEHPHHDVTFRVTNQTGNLVGNAMVEVFDQEVYTNDQGEATILLPLGGHFFRVEADRHTPIGVTHLFVGETAEVDVEMERFFWAVFNISDPDGNEVTDATIYAGELIPEGNEIPWLENGTYSFTITAEGFHDFDGEFVIDNDDAVVDVTMLPIGMFAGWESEEYEITVYPNPARGEFSVRYSHGLTGNGLFSIWNNTGALIWQKDVNLSAGNGVYNIVNAHLSPGIYILRLDMPQGVFFRKIIIQK